MNSNKFLINLLLGGVYLTLMIILTLMSGKLDFFVSCIVYMLIVVIIINRISFRLRHGFAKTVLSILLIYSAYTVFSYFHIVVDPLQDYVVGKDSVTTFYPTAISLSRYSFTEIWHNAFTTYSTGSPLFIAWLGTIQSIINLNDYYSILFQKLNVAFLSSFIPGVVFLLVSRLKSSLLAYRSAIVYGLCSMVFIYSGELLRDTHVALIYILGFYIVTLKKYNLLNYITLLTLCVVAYFLRVESGIFFLAFLILWIYNSGKDRKLMISLFSIVTVLFAFYSIGGLKYFYNMAFETIGRYDERAIAVAEEDSLGAKLRSFPLPLNYIGLFIFSQINPFPFWNSFRGELTSIQNIWFFPFAIAALFWFNVWFTLIYRYKKTMEFVYLYKWEVLIGVGYILLVTMGGVDARRLMAVYPIIFIAYVYVCDLKIRFKRAFMTLLLYCCLLFTYVLLKF